jgi:hypothetical protein
MLEAAIKLHSDVVEGNFVNQKEMHEHMTEMDLRSTLIPIAEQLLSNGSINTLKSTLRLVGSLDGLRSKMNAKVFVDDIF